MRQEIRLSEDARIGLFDASALSLLFFQRAAMEQPAN
jgi:hypothetical protein